MALLIIDLENTCMPEHERPADYHGQIIEIGAACPPRQDSCRVS